MIDSDGVGTCG